MEPPDLAAGEHDSTGAAADDDRSVGEVWPVALLDRGIESVPIDVSDRRRVECRTADWRREPHSPQRPMRAAAIVRATQSRHNVVTNPPPAATAKPRPAPRLNRRERGEAGV